jgi:hypothetical protein
VPNVLVLDEEYSACGDYDDGEDGDGDGRERVPGRVPKRIAPGDDGAGVGASVGEEQTPRVHRGADASLRRGGFLLLLLLARAARRAATAVPRRRGAAGAEAGDRYQ